MSLGGQAPTDREPLTTRTTNSQVEVLPAESEAVLRTIVVPTGNGDPAGGTEMISATSVSSIAVTENSTGTVHAPAGATTVIVSGQKTSGGVSSTEALASGVRAPSARPSSEILRQWRRRLTG